MNLGDVFSGIIPVDSHTRQRGEAVAPVPVPDAGARIGRPSAFSFSAEGARRPEGRGNGDEGSSTPSVRVNLPRRDPPEFMRVIRTSAHVAMQEVRVPDPDANGSYINVERVSVLRFSYVEHPPKPTLWSLQPSVSVSYSLRFDLHPVTEDQLREFEAGEGS